MAQRHSHSHGPAQSHYSPHDNFTLIETFFKVNAPLQFGEEVRVCGNVPNLGCGDPTRAVPLYTTPRDYPTWSSRDGIFLSTQGLSTITYRYCIFSGGKFKRWESENVPPRQIKCSNSAHVVLSDVLDRPESSAIVESDISLSLKSGGFERKQLLEIAQRDFVNRSMTPLDGVIVVSFFLPVTLHKNDLGRWSAQWDTENILSFQTKLRVSWVGCVKTAGLSEDDLKQISTALLQLNCHPVFVNEKVYHDFYELFCKKTIWPVLHHVAGVYAPLNEDNLNAKLERAIWLNYVQVNRLFRDKIIEVYQTKDLIWVHGFHLMMLPSFLRRDIPSCKVGMFFHTPFPSSELWLVLTRRDELIRGILNCDQVGFHLYEYARHFITTCRRLLGTPSEMNPSGTLTVTIDGRDVAVTCMHIGVDLARVEHALSQPAIPTGVAAWRLKFQNKIVIAGIDRMERIKGIPLKLSAIELFAEHCPAWVDKVVFAIIGVSAEERLEDYKETQRDIAEMISRINAKHPGLVYFEERKAENIMLSDRLQFFAAADILLVIPPRDGLNRMPIEFTLAKERIGHYSRIMDPDSKNSEVKVTDGLVVISEFASSARVMRGALVVNPWRLEEVVEALQRSLEMDSSERAKRMRRNSEFSNRLTTLHWAHQVLMDLKKTAISDVPSGVSMLGMGSSHRMLGVKSGFLPLEFTILSRSYRTSKHRLILLDWGGTLVAEDDKVDKLQAYALAQGHATRVGPSSQLKSVLESLCADPRNTVFLVSGKTIDAVNAYFGQVKGLGLAAEHGSFVRMPSKGGQVSQWVSTINVTDETWKEPAKLLMDNYSVRTHGTYVEQKGNAMIWQFRDADLEFGYAQSKELEDNLREILSGYPVEVLRGGGVSDGYIEVRPIGVSKGHFLMHIQEKLKSIRFAVDFIMAVGDDNSDEPMFEAMEQMPKSEHLSKFAVAVGMRPNTAATSYVDDPGQVMECLTMLAKCSSQQNERRYHSVADLQSQVRPQSNVTSFSPSFAPLKGSSGFGRMYRGLSMSDLSSAPIEVVEERTHRGRLNSKDFELASNETAHRTVEHARKAILSTQPSLNLSKYMDSIADNDEEENFF